MTGYFDGTLGIPPDSQGFLWRLSHWSHMVVDNCKWWIYHVLQREQIMNKRTTVRDMNWGVVSTWFVSVMTLFHRRFLPKDSVLPRWVSYCPKLLTSWYPESDLQCMPLYIATPRLWNLKPFYTIFLPKDACQTWSGSKFEKHIFFQIGWGTKKHTKLSW